MSQFKDALSNLLDSYFIVDEQRQVKDHNRTFLELAGTRKLAVRDGLPARCYDLVRLDICQKDCIALRALRAGRTVQVTEIRGKSSDGRNLVLIGSATPLKEDDGSIRSVLVSYRDVTEETELREKLHRLEKETRQEKEVLLKNLTEKTQEVEQLRQKLR